MKKNSHIAGGFIAVAHYRERPDNQEDAGNIKIETASFKPGATIAEVFKAFWPFESDDLIANLLYQPPFRIEISPDENMIPEYVYPTP